MMVGNPTMSPLFNLFASFQGHRCKMEKGLQIQKLLNLEGNYFSIMAPDSINMKTDSVFKVSINHDVWKA